ncbi:S-adenosyl-L-methionine-dependent methyltransferase [Hyaloraphidium curvatum]|nr:S-adenosyl-L-methionine-dependent methyltransferase [Hyaloraphidium curvatum]
MANEAQSREAADETASFYDELAPLYDTIFANWEETIARQATIFDSLFRQEFGITEPRETHLLEIGTGIGTQLIGLLKLGYRATGTDLSEGAVRRCASELEKRGLKAHELRGGVDMRFLDPASFSDAPFRVLLSADNCVPHLTSDDDILLAFKSFLSCLAPGGGCCITVRDYDNESRDKLQLRPYGYRERNGKRIAAFQTWSFDDPNQPDVYDVAMWFAEDDKTARPPVRVIRARYRMISVDRLIKLMAEAGFVGVKRMEGDGGYYQPVIIGVKPQ